MTLPSWSQQARRFYHLPNAAGTSSESKNKVSYRLGRIFLSPPAGLGLKDGPGSARAALSVLGWGGCSSSRHRPGQVLAGYPEGGRRREDERWGRVARSRQMQETTSTRATSTRRTVHGGAAARTPRRWAVAPAVSTPHCLRGTRQDLPCSKGNPAPCDRRAISVQLARPRAVSHGHSRTPRPAGQAMWNAGAEQIPKLTVDRPAVCSPKRPRPECNGYPANRTAQSRVPYTEQPSGNGDHGG
jgi:hypothetical protein